MASREDYSVLAQAFAYPSPGLLAVLADGVRCLDEGSSGEHYRAFVHAIDRLPLSDWEELYTRTLDLNPLVAPYVGYHVWGESYRRGPFLANLNRALIEAGVDTMGELPDHIASVLRYLAVTATPIPELAEVLRPAVDRMVSTLRAAEQGNPYVNLFEAVLAFFKDASKDTARRAEEAA